jgi:glycogen(starch) synthase
MKILMLGWELPPHNSGGLGVACYELCKHLALQGVEIDFVVPYQADHSEISFMKVVSAVPYSPKELQHTLGGAYDSHRFSEWLKGNDESCPTSLREQQQRYVTYVEQLVSEEHYDAVHAHDWLTLEAGMVAKRSGVGPLIAHIHATEFDRAGGDHGNPIVHDIEYTGLLMADRIVAVSQATKNLIVERYQLPADKIEVVHNSIDTSQYGYIDDADTYQYLAHMKQRGYTIAVSIGRLTIQKGLSYLMEAARLTVEVNPKFLLVVAGSGELYQELIAQSADLEIAEHVIFTGFVRGKAWRDLYAIADMFVMPSVSEPFGLTALEAAGYGNAVLISKQSGVGEVLSNVLKFDFWDTHKLASQMVALVDEPSLARDLVENCRQEFNGLSWHQAAERCRLLYRRFQPQEVTT